MRTKRRTFQTSDGVNLSVLEALPENASHRQLTIAWVTGWSMPAAIWWRQFEGLGRRYHMVALDPRGQGESAVPTYGYTAERRATDLHEFVKPVSNVVLVGWSLGAIEALQYVHMFGDDQIVGLVLVDSSVGEEPAPPRDDTFFQRLRNDRDNALDAFVRAIFRAPRTEVEIDRLVQGAKRMAVEDSLALLSYPFERTHWRRIAHAFRKPFLYVVTTQFEEQARNLQKNRPATRVEIFAQAGHALFVDEPDRFNALVDAFVTGLTARPD